MFHPSRIVQPAAPDPSSACDSPAEGVEVLLRRLTANLAHNVNNALTGVIGYLELGRSHPDLGADMDACLQASLECAHQAADAVRRIVRCAGRMSTTEAPAPLSLRRLAEEAAERLSRDTYSGRAIVVGSCTGQVVASVNVIRRALDELLDAMANAAAGRGLTLRLADEDGRCALYIEGAGCGSADLRERLLEPSLMMEIQGGTLEFIASPDEGVSLRLSFPCRGAAPVCRTDAPSAPSAPHLPAALGFLRQVV